MVLIILENVPASLKGELSRWLMEIKAGVFLGRVSAIVRESLWERCNSGLRDGGCLLIHNAPTEQGFTVRSAGNLSRELVDHDGLYLLRRPIKGFTLPKAAKDTTDT